MNKPIWMGIILFLVVFGTFVYFVRHRPVEVMEPEPASGPSPVTENVETRSIEVRLFFYEFKIARLVQEDRKVIFRDDLHGQIKEVLSALIEGPQRDGLMSAIPDGTKLLDIFIGQNGVAYVDFSKELSANHWGGTNAEILTVYSIVNTLTSNFPQIKKVQILIDDHAVETLNGHLNLSRPLSADPSLAEMSAIHAPAETNQN